MRRFSTTVAVLSVALGVAVFAAVIAVDSWQRQQIQRLTAEFAPNVLVVRYADPWPADVAAEPGQAFGLSFEEALSLSEVEGVLAVGYQGSGGRVLGGQLSLQRVPVSASTFEVLGFEFVAGGGFADDARLFDLPVVVLGASAAEELFGGVQAAVGQTVDLGMGVARVEGVLAPVPRDVAEFLYFNAAALVPAGGSFDFFASRRPASSTVFVQHEERAAESVAAGLRTALRGLPTGRVYEVVGPETWLGSQRVFRNRVADELTQGSRWIVLLAVIASVANLTNTLGLRAADRARSLAVRRAVGATKLHVVREMIWDGLRLGVTGTALGLALWPLLRFFVDLGGEGLRFTPEAFLLTVGAGIVLTLLALLVPLLWILRLPIARALREELSPPVWEGVALTGMATGVLALVVATSIGTGTEQWFQKRLAEIGADRVVMTTIGGPQEMRTSVYSPPPFDNADVNAIAALPGVEGVATAAQDSLQVVETVSDSGEAEYEPVVVTRVDPSFFEIYPKPIVHGRAPQNLNEVVVGPLATEWTHPGMTPADAVGREMILARRTQSGFTAEEVFTIVGIFGEGTWDSPGDLFDGAIVRLVRPEDPPLASASGRDLHIRIDLAADYDALLQDIRNLIDERHEGYAPAVVHEPAGDLRQVRTTMANVAHAWSLMAWISLLIGSAGLASIVVVRLVRRRSEDALRRSLGATRANVAASSTVMALRLALSAALVGLFLAGAVTYWVTTLAPWDFSWPWRESLTAVLTALLVALAAVTLPVTTFTRAEPWNALREE